MIKIYCFLCNCFLGWATDCGPGPIYHCDDCVKATEEPYD
jgi:hypothetical protein